MSNKIVTCKECKYYMNTSVCSIVYETRVEIEYGEYDYIFRTKSTPDSFCSKGELKDS